jgi:hypothetical protein
MPLRLTILHLAQRFLTEEDTFMIITPLPAGLPECAAKGTIIHALTAIVQGFFLLVSGGLSPHFVRNPFRQKPLFSLW